MKSKHLDKEDVKKILDGLKAMRADPYALILELILRSGCRTQEVLPVSAKDIDLNKGLLFIHAAKGSNSHQVPVDVEFLTHLKAFIGQKTLKEMFPQMNEQSLKRVLRRKWPVWRFRLIGQGFDNVSLHGLRASFAILIYKNTGDIMLVQELLGHKNLNSTAHYVRLVQAESRKDEILKAIG